MSILFIWQLLSKVEIRELRLPMKLKPFRGYFLGERVFSASTIP